MERSMTGKRKIEKINHQTIRNLTKTQDINAKTRHLKWRWVGHILRGKNKWSKVITTWYPRQGHRKRGRPNGRWEDEIVRTAGKLWTRITQDRTEWKRLEEAFALKQADDQELDIV
ncbi:uncharacterized protein LOC131846852 [Achroia grisella]|uniref:uncharacterized protein LOC131846852 n=1 Tax=Achroia grisella TaxID=688607 RepID=UPI0027D34429|nr:uncharacterized protein LOC131846852 [Achroia grisella]